MKTVRAAVKNQGFRDERAKPKEADVLGAHRWFRRAAVKNQGFRDERAKPKG